MRCRNHSCLHVFSSGIQISFGVRSTSIAQPNQPIMAAPIAEVM